MKFLRYLFIGIIFGIVLTKSEAVSWYRIFEMFRFHSFHMYGIIMVAVGIGLLGVQLIKRLKVKDINGDRIEIADKEKGFVRYIVGGAIFGLGWGLVGSCPGPIYTLISVKTYAITIVFIGALLGTYLYGVFKDRMPH